jgi:hypothetical protein
MMSVGVRFKQHTRLRRLRRREKTRDTQSLLSTIIYISLTFCGSVLGCGGGGKMPALGLSASRSHGGHCEASKSKYQCCLLHVVVLRVGLVFGLVFGVVLVRAGVRVCVCVRACACVQ